MTQLNVKDAISEYDNSFMGRRSSHNNRPPKFMGGRSQLSTRGGGNDFDDVSIGSPLPRQKKAKV
jgi:hypothetical protein